MTNEVNLSPKYRESTLFKVCSSHMSDCIRRVESSIFYKQGKILKNL